MRSPQNTATPLARSGFVRGRLLGAAAIALAEAAWAASRHAPRPAPPQPLAHLVGALRSSRVAAGVWFTMLPALLFGTLGVLAPLRLSHLGWGSLAIGATWLVSAGLEALLAPAVGRISDRRGRLAPIAFGLACSLVVLAVLPWPTRAWLLAVLVVCAGLSFGTFWTPAMSLLTDAADDYGLEHAWAFAIVGLAWAPGQAVGAAAGGAVAKVTADAVVYLALAGLCALTLALLRSRR
jgi:MFS family permease